MAKPVVVVTGISGNLGTRLLPLLGSHSVIGVDVSPPKTDSELQFERLDLGAESSTRTLYELLRDNHAHAVIHLAFVIDPVRTGVLDVERMWRINVAGTARVMEAITEANRTTDDGVKQFIFPSSVSA
ncbi:MAG TPA: NAD-dependent epimerase/dehydratase family protein, partial [Candidatus Acidoferrum sp.]|nr:NAD-dependent epimerase/dehydratase family protein [Candidatus Acidoferrum sp.]